MVEKFLFYVKYVKKFDQIIKSSTKFEKIEEEFTEILEKSDFGSKNCMCKKI